MIILIVQTCINDVLLAQGDDAGAGASLQEREKLHDPHEAAERGNFGPLAAELDRDDFGQPQPAVRAGVFQRTPAGELRR